MRRLTTRELRCAVEALSCHIAGDWDQVVLREMRVTEDDYHGAHSKLAAELELRERLCANCGSDRHHARCPRCGQRVRPRRRRAGFLFCSGRCERLQARADEGSAASEAGST